MSDIAKTVGRRLRSCRQAQSFSQEKLAERAGLHPTYIGQVERGEKNLTIESLEKIAGALNMPIADVFERIEERSKDDNYPLLAYDLFAAKPRNMQAQLYELLLSIDKLSK